MSMDLFKIASRVIIRVARGVSRRLRYLNWKLRLASMGRGTQIFPLVVIHSPENVAIGSRVSIAEFVHIWGGGGVRVGNDVMIASHSVITSQSHDVNAKIYNRTNVMKPVVIEDNVWIGAGAIILPGVRIGSGAVIGAGSVVTKDVAPRTIVVGMPARALRTLRIEQ